MPDSGATWFLPRLVGPAKAAELALLGESLTAADAERFGLVARVVPAEALAAEARSDGGHAGRIGPRGRFALTKHALEGERGRVDLEKALRDEAYRQGIAGVSRPTTQRVWPPSSRSGRRGSPGE